MNVAAITGALRSRASDQDTVGQRVTLWDNAWEQFTPLLDYDVQIRIVLCSTNAIESQNGRFRRAVTVRGHFPTEQAGP